MKLVLFSDVHGRLRIVLHLIRRWQMAHKIYLDGALIAGDLGCFPDITQPPHHPFGAETENQLFRAMVS